MINKSLVSITDFTKSDYLKVLKTAEEFEKNSYQNLLNGKVISTLFFEPSTRTRLSFESAINRLGGKTIGFADSNNSSVTKGETLYDTIKVVSTYCELIVMRHPLEGSARYASENSKVPIVNAGDGANQHPTQTLLDLYTILQTQGTLENLNIVMVGDLKYGRTVHSLLMALSEFNSNFVFISPDELKMPSAYKMALKQKGLKYEECKEMEGQIEKAD
ncbi:MAG: aspartate carbamoyltransferase, partial [Bacteroidales bacterium]|nr:aspartate carbamoyltransferase [Bacteroidales bacterium]